jgi:hypothetical protein
MVLPMLAVVLPLIDDFIVTQILRQLRDKTAKAARRHLCGRQSPLVWFDYFFGHRS